MACTKSRTIQKNVAAHNECSAPPFVPNPLITRPSHRRALDRRRLVRARKSEYQYGMDYRKTAMERAFDLARSGEASNVTDIITSLKREGYSADQIQGASLRRQLAALIKSARSEA